MLTFAIIWGLLMGIGLVFNARDPDAPATRSQTTAAFGYCLVSFVLPALAAAFWVSGSADDKMIAAFI